MMSISKEKMLLWGYYLGILIIGLLWTFLLGAVIVHHLAEDIEEIILKTCFPLLYLCLIWLVLFRCIKQTKHAQKLLVVLLIIVWGIYVMGFSIIGFDWKIFCWFILNSLPYVYCILWLRRRKQENAVFKESSKKQDVYLV